MQKIKVIKVETKQTKNKNTMVAIYDEKSTRFSGFLKELLDVHEGDIIEADIQVDGKYNNIIAVKILEHGNPAGPGFTSRKEGNNSRNGYERRSIERQVAVKVAAQINGVPVTLEKLLKDAEAIALWIAEESMTISAPVPRQTPQDAKSAAPKPEPDRRGEGG